MQAIFFAAVFWSGLAVLAAILAHYLGISIILTAFVPIPTFIVAPAVLRSLVLLQGWSLPAKLVPAEAVRVAEGGLVDE
jgi:hypothetical protein